MTCCGIGHEQMGKCGDRVPKCVICAGPHKIEDHRCGVIGCKVCIHVTVHYENCGGGHSANSSQYTLRHKAEVDAQRRKTLNKDKVKTVETNEKGNNPYSEAKISPEMGMDLEKKDWAQSPGVESLWQDDDESRDYTQDY